MNPTRLRPGVIHAALAVILVASAGCLCGLPPSGSPTTTTTETATTITTTSTTAPPTSTTAKPTTTTARPTTTTVKKPTTTTASTSSTTTTVKGIGKPCQSTADCGGEKTYNSCNNNKIMKYTENPTCILSPEGSYCMAKVRSTIVESCTDGYYCINASCRRMNSSDLGISAAAVTTSTSLTILFPTSSTTTDTIPPATTCMGRSASGSARSQSDCEGLKCGMVSGGRTYTCQFIPGDDNSGHCACK